MFFYKKMKPPKKILIIKLRYLGDVLLTTPVIQSIRKNHPNVHIAVLVNSGTEGILKNNPDIDEIIVLEREKIKKSSFISKVFQECSLVSQLRKRNFDLAIDLSWGDRSAILSFLSGARWRVGFIVGSKVRKVSYNISIQHREDLHMVDYHCLALKAIGGRVHPPELIFNIIEEDQQSLNELLRNEEISKNDPFVVIHPGARWRFKSWPLQNFAGLGDFLQKALSLKVVLVGGDQDAESINGIQSRMHSKVISLGGRLSIQQLGALIKRANLFIGNDSGAMHIAAAVNTPIVAFFGPTDPKMWGPWGMGHTVFYKGRCCHPTGIQGCTWGDQHCMGLISLQEVIETFKGRLAGLFPRPC